MVPFHLRSDGRPHIGRGSIKPSNTIFNSLIPYRSYEVMITKHNWTSREAAEVRVHITNFNLTMKNHLFNGKDPIKIFDFLTHFVNEGDMLSISEVREFIALTTFSPNPAEIKFRTNLSGAYHHRGITLWPEAIQYLLRSYTTASAMREVLEDLFKVKEKSGRKIIRVL